jgi:hypothetical protein
MGVSSSRPAVDLLLALTKPHDRFTGLFALST